MTLAVVRDDPHKVCGLQLPPPPPTPQPPTHQPSSGNLVLFFIFLLFLLSWLEIKEDVCLLDPGRTVKCEPFQWCDRWNDTGFSPWPLMAILSPFYYPGIKFTSTRKFVGVSAKVGRRNIMNINLYGYLV